jgi:CHASE3 domain sensor protein/putative methionine-R-sulfoxide reductase with GAF domain
MKIRAQLFLNNAAILAILIAISVTANRGSQAVIETAEWVSHTQLVMGNTRQIAKLLVDMETGQRGFMLTGNESFLEPYNKGNSEIDQKLDETIEQVSDNPLQVVKLQQVRTLHNQWLADAGEFEIDPRRRTDLGQAPANAIANVLQGRTESGEEKPAGSKAGKDLMDEIRLVLDEIVATENELLDARETENAAAARAAGRIALYGTIVATILALTVGLFVTRQLMNQLGAEPAELKRVARRVAAGVLSERVALGGADAKLVASYVNSMIATFRLAARQADAIAGGDLDLDIKTKGPDDELGNALSRMVHRLREVTVQNEKEAWIKSGQTSVADLLRDQQEIDALAKEVVTEVAKYVGAETGALYIAADETLQLQATYAYSRRKNSGEPIEFGEGLVGQAALEKEIIILTDVPDGFFDVESGLGRTAPRHVIVVPLLHEDSVMGVLELASLDGFEDRHQELLDLVGRNVAHR